MMSGDPRAPLPEMPDGVANIDFTEAWTPGDRLSSRERDERFVVLVRSLLADHTDGVEVKVAELMRRWQEIPGTQPGERPAVNRRIRRLIDVGGAERLERGLIRLEPSAPALLEAAIGVTDSDDEDDE